MSLVDLISVADERGGAGSLRAPRVPVAQATTSAQSCPLQRIRMGAPPSSTDQSKATSKARSSVSVCSASWGRPLGQTVQMVRVRVRVMGSVPLVDLISVADEKGRREPPVCQWSECHKLIQIPLRHFLNRASAMLAEPGVSVLGSGGAPLVSGADPALARHQSGHGLRVGEQNLSPVCQGDLGLVAADGLDLHGVPCG